MDVSWNQTTPELFLVRWTVFDARFAVQAASRGLGWAAFGQKPRWERCDPVVDEGPIAAKYSAQRAGKKPLERRGCDGGPSSDPRGASQPNRSRHGATGRQRGACAVNGRSQKTSLFF